MLASHDREITASSQAALSAHPAMLRWRAKLLAVEQLHQRDMARNHALGDSLAILAAQGGPTPLDTSLRDTVAAWAHAAVLWQATATAREAEARSCGLALSACDQRALSAEQEADSLAARLQAQLAVGRCRVLWVAPCPSRVAVGLGSAILAAVGLLVLKP